MAFIEIPECGEHGQPIIRYGSSECRECLRLRVLDRQLRESFKAHEQGKKVK